MTTSTTSTDQVDRAKRSAVLSFLFMGLGQIYNKQYIKGALLALLELYVIIVWSKPFLIGMWGLYTLGEQTQVRARGRVIEQGDHSIFLMIQGIILLLLLFLFIWTYYINIRDAYKIGELRDLGEEVNTFKESLSNLWENGYPFLLLTPAILFTVFVTILPLVFGIMIAFTNYSSPNFLPPRNLVDWIGFQSFTSLFQMRTWSTTFYGVFLWTCIWAVLATVTTYFVGLFYAVMINHRGIRLKNVASYLYTPVGHSSICFHFNL